MDKIIILGRAIVAYKPQESVATRATRSQLNQPIAENEKWHCNSQGVIRRIKDIFADEPENKKVPSPDIATESQKNYHFFRRIADSTDENI